MRGFVLIGWLCAAIAGATTAWSQPTEYGRLVFIDRNATLDLSIMAVSAAHTKVSGTNVTFDVVPVLTVAQNHADPYWHSARVINVTVKIGGETVYNFGGTENNPFALEPGPRVVCRWATTHFDHGSHVEIEAYALCKLYHNGEPNDEKDFAGTSIIDVDAYNVAVQLATVETYGPNPGNNNIVEYFEDPNGLVATVAKKVVDVARGVFPNSHLEKPGSYAGESSLREETTGSTPMLDQLMKESTVFFGCTHGENLFFRSSKIDDLLGNEVTSYVQNQRTVPPHNMVIMYACWLNNTNFSHAFEVLPFVNRAYVCFPSPVSVAVKPKTPTPGTVTIEKHAEVLLSQLKAGVRVEEALELANELYQPVDLNGIKVDMWLNGDQDKYAKLWNVYLTQAETEGPIGQGNITWYYCKRIALPQ